MDIASLVLPLFAVIVTGWIAGATGYMPKSLAGPLMQFAYYVAMPALIFITIAQQPLGTLLDARFILAFGGGSMIIFAGVVAITTVLAGRSLGSATMLGAAAAMTNTGFVALPILHAMQGHHGVLSAAIATAFIGVVMFPVTVILLEIARRGEAQRTGTAALAKQIVINPVIISTVAGLAWSITGVSVPAPIGAYLDTLGHALTACALFSIGLSISLGDMRERLAEAAALTVVKLIGTPLIVYAIAVALRLDPTLTTSAVVCAAVPTAKTAYVLAHAYCEEEVVVGSTISMNTLLSVVTLLAWLLWLG